MPDEQSSGADIAASQPGVFHAGLNYYRPITTAKSARTAAADLFPHLSVHRRFP
jgi:hypothetical protein